MEQETDGDLLVSLADMTGSPLSTPCSLLPIPCSLLVVAPGMLQCRHAFPTIRHQLSLPRELRVAEDPVIA
jgi:hypothetical protein